MPDIIHKANDLADLEREAAIYYATRRPLLPYVGRCYNCDQPIEAGAFCDPACAEDHGKRKRFNR